MSWFGRRKKAVDPFSEQEKNLLDADYFQERLREANGMADAGERLFRLAKLKSDIETEIADKHALIAKQGSDKSWQAFIGGNTASFAALAALSMAFPPAIAFVPLTMMGSIMVSTKYQKSFEARAEKEARDYFNLLDSRKKIVSEWEDRLMEERLDAIAQSASCARVFAEYPAIKDRFAVFAAKKMAVNKNQPPKPADDDRPKF